MSAKLAGFREPGLRKAGEVSASGGGGGSSAAAEITLADAGGFYTSGFVEGALAEVGTAMALRPLASDLASTALGFGADLIGTHSGTLYVGGVSPTVEGALVSIEDDLQNLWTVEADHAAARPLTTDLASTTGGLGATMIGFNNGGSYVPPIYGATVQDAVAYLAGSRPLTVDLASTTAGKGASTIGLQDAGSFYTTDNVEAALQQLGPAAGGAFTIALGATLSDAGAATQPDLFTIAHLANVGTTPLTNFGLSVGRELHTDTRTRRRALNEITKWTTATDASATASHTLQLRTAGTLTDVVTFGASTRFPTIGTVAAPTISMGSVANCGLYGNGDVCVSVFGVQAIRFVSGEAQIGTPVVAPIDTAADPSYSVGGVNARTGGMYSVTAGMGFSVGANATLTNVLTLTKTASPFVFTAPTPTTANNTAATEFVGFDVNMSRTSNWNGTAGSFAKQREVLIRRPTYSAANASMVITTAATLALEGDPQTTGGNLTITTPLSLWSQQGIVRFDCAGNYTSTLVDLFTRRGTSTNTTAAGFGVRSITELQAWDGTFKQAGIDTTEWTTNVTPGGTEESRRVFSLYAAGSLVKVGGFGWQNSGTGATLYLHDPVQTMGFRAFLGPNKIQAIVGGVASLEFSSSALIAYVPISTDRITMAPLATTTKILAKFSLTPAADTGTTTAVEAMDVDFNLSRIRTWVAGTVATQRAFRLRAPTYAGASATATFTTAATFSISGAPIAGTNAAITNAYSLWVEAGAVRFDASFGLNKAPVAQQNTTGTATGFTAGGGTTATDASTFTGGTGATAYRISDIVLALKNYGLLAA